MEGLKSEFFKRHKKDRKRAQDAWEGFVARRRALVRDVQMGEPVPNSLRPKEFREYNTLYLIPESPHRFRALYEVSTASSLDPVVVTIVWIGEYSEYDQLFGFSTS